MKKVKEEEGKKVEVFKFFFFFFGCSVAYGVSRPGIRSKPQFRPMPQLGQCRSLTRCAGPEIELVSWCCRDTADLIVLQQELLFLF